MERSKLAPLPYLPGNNAYTFDPNTRKPLGTSLDYTRGYALVRDVEQDPISRPRPATARPASANSCPYAYDGDDSETGVHIARRKQWAPASYQHAQAPAWLAFDRQVRMRQASPPKWYLSVR